MVDRTSRTQPKSIYTDVPTSFTRHPTKKDLTVVTNQNSVAQAIRNLILTNKGERLFRPAIGSNINRLLFEPLTDTTASSIKTSVIETINNFEPRANVISVTVEANYPKDGYNIQIIFTTINVTVPQRLNVTLYRVR